MTIGLNYGNHEGNVYTSYLGALDRDRPGAGHGHRLLAGAARRRRVLDDDAGRRRRPGGQQRERARPAAVGLGPAQDRAVNDLPPAPPGEVLRGVATGRCVDVPGFSTTNGTALDLWDCNGGGNQSWNWTADKQLTVYGNKCMTIGGDGASGGSPVIITDCTGAPNQAGNSTRTSPSPASPTRSSAWTPPAPAPATARRSTSGTATSRNQQWTRS